jgi:3-deoxy-manno-octulosonate cytidylyltransferase (CMP-KDO synthetase)
MGSSRYPGKPLAALLGRPMIEHVYRRARMCRSLGDVIVATCDDEIRAAAEGFGARVAMTSHAHERAADRVAEAAAGSDADVVVLLQGDEPMIRPEMIDAAVAPFSRDPKVRCVNLTKRIASEAEFLNPNTIKVVMNANGDALFMSRQPIPTRAKAGFAATLAYKQVCVIPFRRDALALYARLDPTPLEILESVDMLRFLEHGHPVRMIETGNDSRSVDTPAERNEVEALLRDDPLVARYLPNPPSGEFR